MGTLGAASPQARTGLHSIREVCARPRPARRRADHSPDGGAACGRRKGAAAGPIVDGRRRTADGAAAPALYPGGVRRPSCRSPGGRRGGRWCAGPARPRRSRDSEPDPGPSVAARARGARGWDLDAEPGPGPDVMARRPREARRCGRGPSGKAPHRCPRGQFTSGGRIFPGLTASQPRAPVAPGSGLVRSQGGRGDHGPRSPRPQVLAGGGSRLVRDGSPMRSAKEAKEAQEARPPSPLCALLALFPQGAAMIEPTGVSRLAERMDDGIPRSGGPPVPRVECRRVASSRRDPEVSLASGPGRAHDDRERRRRPRWEVAR
jgi:hypothetical protein